MLSSLFQIAEIIAVCTAAISGVLAAAHIRADLLGAVILGCTTAFGGGIVRDLLLGITPPSALQNPRMLLIAAAVSLAVFCLEYFWGDTVFRRGARHEHLLNLLDALSLSMFVIVGIDTAQNAGYADHPFLTVFVGVVTGVGGGVLRDMMIRRIPVILQKRIYALAAMLGAALDVFLSRHVCSTEWSAVISVCVILLIRFLSAQCRWNLPRYPKDDKNP